MVQSQGSTATTVDRDLGWRFCSDAYGVYFVKEDNAPIGQPGRVAVHNLLRHARSEVVLPAAPQVPPIGETEAHPA